MVLLLLIHLFIVAPICGVLCLVLVLLFSTVVVDSLLVVTPAVGFCNCSMFCCTLLCVHSSFAIILMGKRELVALLSLCSGRGKTQNYLIIKVYTHRQVVSCI